MTDIDRDEFEALKRQVRTLQRRVDEQQKQIATLKRRTTTETPSSASSSSSDSKDQVEVPRSSEELQVLDSLREHGAESDPLDVEVIKNEAAQAGLLRSAAKSVVRKWIKQGYLVGDLDGSVKVEEWPSETVPPE